MVVHCACLNLSGPPGDEGNAYTALGCRAFCSAKQFLGVEVVGVGAALGVGAVVTCEYYECVLVESFLFEFVEYLADVCIETCHHCCKLLVCAVGGVVARTGVATVALLGAECSLIGLENAILGLCKLGVGQGVGEYSKEGLVGCLFVNPRHCTLVDKVGRVVFAVLVLLAVHSVCDVVL